LWGLHAETIIYLEILQIFRTFLTVYISAYYVVFQLSYYVKTQGTIKMKSLRFIYEFLKYPIQVGTMTQSSKCLAKRMAEQIDGSTEVVEFGAGTGSVTKEILKQLPQDGRLTCFEINPQFCKCLERINDERLKVINDDAKNCEQYIDDPDCIVSGLPLTLFKKLEKEKILTITSKSKRYIQLQYTPILSKEIKQYFSDVKLKFVPQNLPPAFIYVCSATE
jgi:phospholipid N-methyltransferase